MVIFLLLVFEAHLGPALARAAIEGGRQLSLLNRAEAAGLMKS